MKRKPDELEWDRLIQQAADDDPDLDPEPAEAARAADPEGWDEAVEGYRKLNRLLSGLADPPPETPEESPLRDALKNRGAAETLGDLRDEGGDSALPGARTARVSLNLARGALDAAATARGFSRIVGTMGRVLHVVAPNRSYAYFPGIVVGHLGRVGRAGLKLPQKKAG